MEKTTPAGAAISNKGRCCFVALLAMLFLLTGFTNSSFAQTYILNEDFSSASGTTPPSGWLNHTGQGAVADKWHFDNPGNRSINYPFTGKFAIFDSENYSGGGGAEKVTLETKFFDASVSNNTVLYFDHFFASGRNGKGFVDVFDGFNWQNLASYTDSTANPQSEVYNISSIVGGVTNAKVRFRWEGDSSMYWALDNIRIYAPLTLDAGVTAVVSPTMPFNAGNQAIKVRLTNFGATTLTSTTIGWSVNNVVQPDYSWSGSLALGANESNVTVGNYNFPSGKAVNLKVWQKNPNGLVDGNLQNDTMYTTLSSSLCGTYTIGGLNPDFATFNDAAIALNNAGVSCAVEFLVRSGVYDEQLKLGAIAGTSISNTITFKSETGYNRNVTLDYTGNDPRNNYTIIIDGASFINFENLTINRSNYYNNNLKNIVINKGADI
ncbi:MAG: hypothetical protein LPK19_14915, partial [Hymenobacteraceae bacterium]|nr:hypothetical protein [Hymenobacteraceae bacterium]MDX5397525.1 hypothetical protein [Hymenobacteraceae bacterium]MDX5513603.1 hypothetical protein [Hymenobacteraceae bacterium]